MSIDSSLRMKSALVRHRNVLTRAERIAKMKDLEKWTEDTSVLGLPKISNRKAKAKKKAKAEGEAAATGEAAAPGAAAAAPTAGAAAKPAAGAAKAAAPAAKAAAPKK